MKTALPGLILGVLAVLGTALQADALVRMAIVVGNNSGLANENPLSYAVHDAEKVYATLLQLGGLDQGKGYLLLDPDVARVKDAFREVRARSQSFRGQGRKVQILVYFSGHGSVDALHLNGAKLPMGDIRAFFQDVDADLKLLIADACYSGSLIQAKGAALAEPVQVGYRDDLKVNGSAILTSSSAGELSQESRELQGSVFTHYFLSALRGGADFDRDGKITLWEAYNFTRYSLRRKLASVEKLEQNPGFDVDIQGSDNVVLTRLELGQALLTLKGLPEGQYRILEANSALEIAQVDVSGPDGLVVALPKAAYLVYRNNDGQETAGIADLRRKHGLSLGPEDFHPVTAGRLTAKGGMSGNSPAFAGRAPFQLSLQSRFYPEFPGRTRAAMAMEASLMGAWRNWALQGSFDYLRGERVVSSGAALDQDGYGGAGELRYYWSYSGRANYFAGPRLEAWSLGQIVNGREYGRAGLAGTFAFLGMEWSMPFSLSLSFSMEAGAFWSYDAEGALRRSPAFPLSLALRYHP
ncbi:MAG TPA: caspase family protein [Fibrobacteria bacterium]|nr:caspase family protein [Fibrobacteria bacterium]